MNKSARRRSLLPVETAALAVDRVKRALTSNRRRPQQHTFDFQDAPDDVSAFSALGGSSTSAIENIKTDQWIHPAPNPSKRQTFTFGLLRALASTAARSHPAIRDGIVLHSLKILKAEFPIREKDPEAVDVFDNLLKLAHPESRNKKARTEALALLLVQIQSGYSNLLAEMISEGPDNEIRALVSDLIASLPNKWMETRRQDIHIQLQDIFLAASPHGHSLLPFLQFLLTLSQQSVSCAQAILESGYLDIILCVSLAAFADISPTQIGDCERSQDRQVLPAIFAFFLSTLSVLAAHPVNHPSLVKRWALLRRFWASSCLQAFDEAYCNCVISQYPQPCIAVLERPFILRRLSALSTAFNRHDPEPFIRGNGCSELISLSRNCRHDSDIQAFVIAILSGFFVSPTFHRNGWRELHVQFCRSSFNVVVDILSSLMSYVLGEHTPVFAELRPARDFSELLNSLLEFADFTTQSSLTLRTAFVEAGILALQPYRDQDFWQRFQYTPSVPIGSRDKLVRVLDEEKANVLRILGQKAEQVALG